MVGGERTKFVLFGSSIVQYAFSNNGWASILADFYSRKADIVLRGYAGWNSRRALQVLNKVFPKTADVQPDLVIVYFGGNDSSKPHPSGLGPHVPLPEYVENMKKIALHVKSLSEKTRVIFLTSPPVNETQYCNFFGLRFGWHNRTNELSGVYAKACVEMCKDLNIKVIDLWSVLQKQSDWLTACFTDGIHLSPEGSKIVAKEILTVLEETDWEPNLHWKFLPSEFDEDSPYDHLASDGRSTCITRGPGSKMVAKEILAVLEETDWEPNLHWKSLPSEFSEDSHCDNISSDDQAGIQKDIENRFFRASECGREVSRMLEANKIRIGYSEARGKSSGMGFLEMLSPNCCGGGTASVSHEPSHNVTKVITWNRSTSARSSSSRSPLATASKDDNDDSGSEFAEEFCMIAGSHSSTLDRMYAWERKLYDEVKASECIRREYDRKCDQLRHQFAKDLSSSIIDKTRSVIKDHHSRTIVALHAVDSIAKRIEKMRDEELLPQLIELVQG